MKTLKQLLRQPLKSLLGFLLITLAVSILITCVGQYFAAALTWRNIEGNYHTVAVPQIAYRLDKWGRDTGRLSEDIEEWIYGMAQEYPELVKGIYDNSLFSAYIPELIADNPTQYDYTGNAIANPYFNSPNCCALLEVTLTEIGTEYTSPTFVRASQGDLLDATLV